VVGILWAPAFSPGSGLSPHMISHALGIRQQAS
jgi:hypothetical protein